MLTMMLPGDMLLASPLANTMLFWPREKWLPHKSVHQGVIIRDDANDDGAFCQLLDAAVHRDAIINNVRRFARVPRVDTHR